MRILLATIAPRAPRAGSPTAELLDRYLLRAGRYADCSHQAFSTESRFLEALGDGAGRTRSVLLLADSRGTNLSSEDLARLVRGWQGNGIQRLVAAIGPADGWSAAALQRADHTVSFGKITLPHELAAVVAAEQIYRALTQISGHPYHTGH